MNIELYIANKLCDLEKSDLSIRLKRQFINPSELNTKDAQKSYTITLPSTPVNDEIFKYKNVEETDGKFTIYPDARLYVNGILILEGKFRLSEITRDSYKGNLGVPTPLTVKDVFGEMKMNEAGSWEIPFVGKDSISKYNNDSTKNDIISPAIFPLALYGLLPKFAKVGNVSQKYLYDNQVTLDLDNFPPSVNCLQMLEKIFENSNYQLAGTAFNDERLKNLYVSYKNPNEYKMNWGANDSFSIKGASWGVIGDFEPKVRKYAEPKREENYSTEVCATNLFDCDNFRHEGKNMITHDWVKQGKKGFNIVVPATGLYKIHLTMECTYPREETEKYNDFKVRQASLKDPYTSEVYLVRNRTKSLTELSFNNKFAKNAINQRYTDLSTSKIFPVDNNVHFIDPYHDPTLLCGFAFGQTAKIEKEPEEGEEKKDKEPTQYNLYINPQSISKCNPIAISGARSWNYPETTFQAFSAVPSKAYHNSGGRFKIDIAGAEAKTERVSGSEFHAKGTIEQVIWLEKGDSIEMLDVSTIRWYKNNVDTYEICNHSIKFDLDIIPFRKDKEWIKVDINGTGMQTMNWNDTPNIRKGELNLISFLPSEVTVNDWVDNFCKAFNLSLNNTKDNNFELNLKETELVKSTSKTIDLDQKTNVVQGVNEPLNLPYLYEFGFAADNKEDGYIKYLKENGFVDPDGKPLLNQGYTGGGKFYTNSQNANTTKQSSNFAYCWYRKLYKDVAKTNLLGEFPSISEHEVWENNYDYEEMMPKKFLNKAQRFWYPSGSVNLELFSGNKQDIALVSNTYHGNKPLALDYEDKPNSIMRNYFMLLTNQKEYTVVECYLTPEEYNDLDKAYIKFNGDLYIVAEADGYDPMGKSKTKMKLIKQ